MCLQFLCTTVFFITLKTEKAANVKTEQKELDSTRNFTFWTFSSRENGKLLTAKLFVNFASTFQADNAFD